MDLFIICSSGFIITFLSGFLFARYLYLKNFNKKISNYHKINSSLNEKYFFIFQKNKNLQEKLKLLQPNLISLDAIFEKMIVSKNWKGILRTTRIMLTAITIGSLNCSAHSWVGKLRVSFGHWITWSHLVRIVFWNYQRNRSGLQ